MWGIAIALSIMAITLGYFFLKRKYSYWSSRGVPVPPYLPLLGHLHRLFMIGHRWEYLDKIYNKYEDERIWGMYEGLSPYLFIKDLELVKNILVKDADHFVDRRSLKFYGKDKIFNEMVNIIKGEEWKALRAILTSTFSSGNIEKMFPLILPLSDDLITKYNKELLKGSEINITTLFREYTVDVLVSCSIGIESQCLLDKKSEATKDMNLLDTSIIGILKFVYVFLFPRAFVALGLRCSTKTMGFLEEAVRHTIKVRMNSGKRRGDFVDLLLNAFKEQKKSEDIHKYPMTYDTIASQSLLYLLAGFETTSNALSFTTHLLAKNSECQKKLRNELQVIYETDGGFTYKNILEAQYLDACFSESLRMYPIAHFLERVCTQEYRLPGTDIDIEVSKIVAVPVWSLHYDPKYWNEPKKFDPNRFLPENKQYLVPYAYMPFGLGPRNCIGMRFALIFAKVALAKLCLNYEFSLKPGFEEVTLGTIPSFLQPDKNFMPLILTSVK